MKKAVLSTAFFLDLILFIPHLEQPGPAPVGMKNLEPVRLAVGDKRLEIPVLVDGFIQAHLEELLRIVGLQPGGHECQVSVAQCM